MIGLYLSGTGNTRYCVEYLLRLLDETAEAVPIEEENAAERAAAHSSIVLAYPIQYSNAPLMVRAFIRDHAELWRGSRSSAWRPWARSAATARAAPPES